MLILDVDDAVRLIEPYRVGLVEAVEEAFQDYLRTGYNRTVKHHRVTTNMIWNQVLHHGERRFHGDQNFRLDQVGDYHGFVIRNDVFVRVKQARDGLRSRNYRTRGAAAFLDLRQDLFGGVARLELLWTLDDLKTEVSKVQLAQRHMDQVLWAIDLRKGIEPVAQMPIALQPVGPVGSPAERIIKSKKSGARDHAVQDRTGSDG